MKRLSLTVLSLAAATLLAAPACKKDQPKPAPAEPQSKTEAEEEDDESPRKRTPRADASAATAGAQSARPVAPDENRRPMPEVKTVEQHLEIVRTEIVEDNYKEKLAELEGFYDLRAKRNSPDAPRPRGEERQPAGEDE